VCRVRKNAGVLCAPTAFSKKTVIAAALIARKDVNALVLVRRADPLKHGRSACKLSWVSARAPNVPRVLLSIGKLVEEGFDHPPLDPLVLAIPMSWGRAATVCERLHREHASKSGEDRLPISGVLSFCTSEKMI
jgi:hypothetical protein